MLPGHVLIQVFCDQIGGIGQPMDFVGCHLGAFELMLKPEKSDIQMSQLSEARSSGNANCRARVRMDRGLHFHSHVGQEGYEAESLCGALGEGVEFGLCTAQGYSRLGARPGLERVCTEPRHTAARAAAGGSTPRPVGVRENIHSLRHFLPPEMLDQSRRPLEVSADPFEGCPVALSRSSHAATALLA